MRDDERRRRMFAAQGLAAVALFVFAHGTHAATPPTPAASTSPAAAATANHP